MILPPSIQQIEAAAQAAIENLPAGFRSRLQSVVLRVEDWPDDETLDALEIESPYELTGLYRGHTVAEPGYSGQLPDTIHLYRRPILDEWCEHGEVSLGELVAHVLVHEIGHHFGLSDEDMEAIEAAAG